MQEVGSMLQARRQELNLSLKEVENATSIRMSYLKAIEEGDMAGLISHVYAAGFVKQYAAFLGLDGEEIVAKHPTAFAPQTHQEFSYGIGTLEQRNITGSSASMSTVLWVVAFAAIAGLAFGLAHYLELL